jgi:serine/threonine protein kinase
VLKFRREAEAGGRQSHPGIVAVHAVGEHEGFHYIAQELIEGSNTLADRLDSLRKEGDPPPGYFREVARHLFDVAEAMHHAHESGVIHRDIKPSNILLTTEGHPKVTDFGLAKLEDALALSRTGDFAGTPYYMSPEQVTSRTRGIDKRTDIYSLGVTLYEMLTLQRPFEGKSSYEVLKKIPIVDPVEPHKANSRVPRDLSLICMKAMEKTPEKRYPTMKEFGDDLRRFLSGEVILAKPAGTATRVLKRVKRNPLISGAVGLALAAMVALIIWGVWYFIQMKIHYEEILRYSDLDRIYRLQAEEELLWPAYPEKLTAIKKWLEQANELKGRLDQHIVTIEILKAKEKLNPEEQVLFERLEKLISGVASLADEETGMIRDMQERLHFAETIHEESIEKQKKNWQLTIASISDPEKCPQYHGLQIDPQIGLVPLGQDPKSGFWEFAHLQTGEIPERGDDGQLVITEETGIVFVLLPGGTFRMGTMLPDSEHPEGDPHVDPEASASGGPVHSVTLDPFFISKYEMTQGQWLRIAGENPCMFYPGSKVSGKPTGATLRNPVELVSWNDCDLILKRLNLTFPREAQWEYACRGGTTTIWYTGNDPRSLNGYENLADAGSKDLRNITWRHEDWLDDGHGVHAPVGTYRANPFGLHDMVGNVSEWCFCYWRDYKYHDVSPGTGEALGGGYWPHRVYRGSSFWNVAAYGKSAVRKADMPRMRSRMTGVRPAMLVHQ